ncbi:hypothetical protein [Oerskovia flava]|uniref:hypothetical protein n=1 Tax=Oerskovia flava TaxID=2986422 RepID=UPI00223F01AE|nr:hypothetical protein [Oerskovia sp. JB1-3-2]
MVDDDRTAGPDGSQRPERRTRTPRERGSGLALFAEVLLVGALVLVGSLLVVTAPAAVAAGVAHLRRHVAGRPDGVGQVARDAGSALRNLWPVGLGLLAAAVLLELNLQLAASGLLPGAALVRAVSLVALLGLVVIALRAAAAWSWPDGVGRARPAVELARDGLRRTREDPTGSFLLAVAVGVCGLFVWMLVPLVIVVPGLLCLAVVGVEARRGGRPPTV